MTAAPTLPQSIPPTITRVISADVLDGTQPHLVWLARRPSPANPQTEIRSIFLCDDPFVGIEVYSSQKDQPIAVRTTLRIEDVRCLDEVMDVQSWEQERADAEPDRSQNAPRFSRMITRDLLAGSDKRMVWQLGQDFPLTPGLQISHIFLCDDPFVGVEVYGVGLIDGHPIGMRSTVRKEDVLCLDEVMSLEQWISALRESDAEDPEEDPEEEEEEVTEPAAALPAARRDTVPASDEKAEPAALNGAS